MAQLSRCQRFLSFLYSNAPAVRWKVKTAIVHVHLDNLPARSDWDLSRVSDLSLPSKTAQSEVRFGTLFQVPEALVVG